MTDDAGFATLLSDLETFSLFKEYMESRYASEIVVAFIALQRLHRASTRARKKAHQAFVDTYLHIGGARELNIELGELGQVQDSGLTDAQLALLSAVILNALKIEWFEFSQSKLYQRFLRGEYTPKLAQPQHRRLRFANKSRSQSDDMILEHFRTTK